MGEIVKDTIHGLPWYMYGALFICIGLGIAGFILPPKGEIDPSVLTFVGEILGGAWLFNFSMNLPRYIQAGASVRLEHKDTSVEVTSK